MIKVVNGNILDFDSKVEVIVNVWNRNFIPHRLLITHGVSKDIILLMKLKNLNLKIKT